MSDEASADAAHFRIGQLALNPIGPLVDDLGLALVQRLVRDSLAKPRLAQYIAKDGFRAIKGTMKAVDEPQQQPGRYIEPALLRRFEHGVLGFALGADFCADML